MKIPKTIQVDFELFCNMCSYFLSDEEELHETICQGLEKKVDKIIANQYYSKYKSTPPSEEREEWRKKYLEHVGIHKDWQSSTEIPGL